MGRIRLFPLLFQNGCSQSSRFLPQARRIVGSGDENGLTVDVPRTLPQQLSMLEMLGKEHEARPLIKKMFLMAFGLSGNPLKYREFSRGLVTSSYNCGDVEISNSTHPTLQRELHFCGSLQIDCVSPTSSQA